MFVESHFASFPLAYSGFVLIHAVMIDKTTPTVFVIRFISLPPTVVVFVGFHNIFYHQTRLLAISFFMTARYFSTYLECIKSMVCYVPRVIILLLFEWAYFSA